MSNVIRAALIALALLAGPALSSASRAPLSPAEVKRIHESLARLNALQAQEQAALRQVQLARTTSQREKALLAARLAGELTRQARQNHLNLTRLRR